jgi:predicted nucleic acid-binding protein
MANLTISIDDELLHRARVRAAERGTSVNAVLRAYLTEWIGKRSRRHRIAFWDALIVEAALSRGCTTLLSEDLQDGRRFGALVIENPFRDVSRR